MGCGWRRRRWGRALVAASVLAAAGCSSIANRDLPPVGGEAPASEDGSGQPPGDGDPSSLPDATAPPGGGDDASDAGPGGAPGLPPVDPNGPVGSYSIVLLRPARSSSIELRVLVEGGAGPNDATLGGVRGTLSEVTGKPVAVSGPAAVADHEGAWTAADIRRAAMAAGAGSGDRAAIRLLFLDGGLAENDAALGVAVSASVAAIFTDKVAEAAGLLGDRRRIELAVTTHEVGHLLGLVDLTLDTGREDPEHPGHSRNRESVMHWAVETDLVTTLLEGGPPTTFDDADRSDLAAIRDGVGPP